MPQVIKCPNCHAPLDKPPTGPDARCSYCGALLQATTYMPAPPLAPPGAPPPAGVPYPPYAPYPPGAPPVQAPNQAYQALQQALQAAPAVERARRTGVVISLVTTLLVFGGVGVAGYFAYREQQQQQQRQETAKAPMQITGGKLEVGKSATADLPGTTSSSYGPRVVTFEAQIAEQGYYQLSLSVSTIVINCQLKVLDAAGKTVVQSARDDSADALAELAAGGVKVVLDCDAHPASGSVRVGLRALPAVQPGTPVNTTIDVGMKTAGVLVQVPEKGLWAVAVLADDSSVEFDLLAPGDVLVGSAQVDSSTDRAIVEASLEAQAHLARVRYYSAATQVIPVGVAVTRVDPEPIALDTQATGTLTRFVRARYYLLKLDQPTAVEAVAESAAFGHRVEIQSEQGLRLAGDDSTSSAGRPDTAASPGPLAAGTYRIAVFGESHEASEGLFALRVRTVRAEGAGPEGGGDAAPGLRRGAVTPEMVVSALNRASRSCRFRQAVSGVTRITISGAGRVTSVNVTGDGIDADTARCMANAIKRATFPASGDSLTISLPFNFSP